MPALLRHRVACGRGSGGTGRRGGGATGAAEVRCLPACLRPGRGATAGRRGTIAGHMLLLPALLGGRRLERAGRSPAARLRRQENRRLGPARRTVVVALLLLLQLLGDAVRQAALSRLSTLAEALQVGLAGAWWEVGGWWGGTRQVRRTLCAPPAAARAAARLVEAQAWARCGSTWPRPAAAVAQQPARAPCRARSPVPPPHSCAAGASSTASLCGAASAGSLVVSVPSRCACATTLILAASRASRSRAASSAAAALVALAAAGFCEQTAAAAAAAAAAVHPVQAAAAAVHPVQAAPFAGGAVCGGGRRRHVGYSTVRQRDLLRASSAVCKPHSSGSSSKPGPQLSSGTGRSVP